MDDLIAPTKPPLKARLKRYWAVYLIMAPALIWIFLFKIWPIGGNAYAFVDFRPARGLFGSEWVGLRYFEELFAVNEIGPLLRNTLVISGLRLLFGFPFPLILAILIHEIRRSGLRRIIQSTVYLPHFISWPVVAGITMRVLSPTDGLVNEVIEALGGQSIYFMTEPGWFRPILVIQGIWKEAGWGTVLYLAALAGVDPNLYESAMVDGATKWQRIRHVTLPAISGTVVVLLILSVGNMINENFQQILVMLNPLVFDVGDVFETFVFRQGIGGGRFSYATAVGLFKSVVAFIMIVGANMIARRTKNQGLF
jgi:putative aldouronate transport system permease protein